MASTKIEYGTSTSLTNAVASLASMGYGDAGLPEGYYVTDPGYADDFADEAFGFPTFGGF